MVTKLLGLGVLSAYMPWIKDFLTDPLLSNPDTQHWCVAARLCAEPSSLVSLHLWLHNPHHKHNNMFVNDTTVVGLIQNKEHMKKQYLQAESHSRRGHIWSASMQLWGASPPMCRPLVPSRWAAEFLLPQQVDFWQLEVGPWLISFSPSIGHSEWCTFDWLFGLIRDRVEDRKLSETTTMLSPCKSLPQASHYWGLLKLAGRPLTLASLYQLCDSQTCINTSAKLSPWYEQLA